jgi:hypothetical protein
MAATLPVSLMARSISSPLGEPDPVLAPSPPLQLRAPWSNPAVISPPTFPACFRLTTHAFPSSPGVAARCGVPLGIALSPGLAADVPLISAAEPIPRCPACTGFSNPYVRDSLCPFCRTPMPRSAIATANVYDLFVPPQLWRFPNACSALFFVVDVSTPARLSGFAAQFLLSLRASLPSIADGTLVGFGTMADRLTVYDLKRRIEWVCSDLSDPLIPTIRLLRLGSVRERLAALLDWVIASAPSASATGHCLGSVLEIAESVLGKTGGILVLAAQGLPTFGRLALQPRARPPNGVETPLLHMPVDQPQCQMYRELAGRLNRRWISVHFYSFTAGGSPDLAVTAIPVGLTGGHARLYNADNLESLHPDLFADLTAPYFFASILQLRVSNKVKIANTNGNCMLAKQSNYLCFPVLGPRDSIAIELEIEEQIKEKEIYVQMCLMWSRPDRRRMLRIFTFAIPVTNVVATIQRAIDEVGLTAVLARRTAVNVLASGSVDASLHLKRAVRDLVRRKATTPGLFHLAHALAVSSLLAQQHPAGPDGRILDALRTRAANPVDLLLNLYPRLFSVDTDQGPLPLAPASFESGAVFLFHRADGVIVWVSAQADAWYVVSAFGVATLAELPADIPTLNSPENERLRALYQQCCELSGKYLPVELICQGDAREAVLNALLVDAQPANPLAALDVWMRELKHV